MNKFVVSILGIALASALTGCGKGIQLKDVPAGDVPNNNKPQAVDLNGKNLDEVLTLKYDKAELVCSLWIQQSKDLELKNTPNDQFVVDLKSKPAIPQTLELKASIPNHEVVALVTLSEVNMLGYLNHTDLDGNVYKAHFSPTVKYVFEYKSQTKFGNGLFGGGSANDVRDSREKIVDQALKISVGSNQDNNADGIVDEAPFHTVAQCLLNTEIKPEYQDQFQVEKRK